MSNVTKSTSRALVIAGVAASLAAAAQSSHAVYSPLLAPPGGEKSVAEILGNSYGGAFSLVGATKNYSNGSGIFATRIDDSTAGGASTNLINLPTGDRADQLWSDGIAEGVARARWAGYNQKFGYMDGWTGGSYHNLFDVVGSGYGVTGEETIDFGDALGNPAHWRWARSGDGGTWSSLESDNGGGDHMITYMITGLTGQEYVGKTVWMLAWEDLNLGDQDYNDLVVEVVAHAKPTGLDIAQAGVPEPITAGLSALSIGALALGATRRRKLA